MQLGGTSHAAAAVDKQQQRVLDASLLSGSLNVDDYAKAILRGHSLEQAQLDLETLRLENLELKGKLARSQGDFTDDVFLALVKQRDQLLEQVNHHAAAAAAATTTTTTITGTTPQDWYSETFQSELSQVNNNSNNSNNDDSREELEQYQFKIFTLEEFNNTLLEKISWLERKTTAQVEDAKWSVLTDVFKSWRHVVWQRRRVDRNVRKRNEGILLLHFKAWQERRQRSAHLALLSRVLAKQHTKLVMTLCFHAWKSFQVKAIPTDTLTLSALKKAASEAKVPAIMYASSRGLSELVIQLVGEGSPVNLRSTGSTPLHAAAEAGFPHTVEVLLDAGADAELKNDLGETSLERVVKNNQVEVVRMLLAKTKPADSQRVHRLLFTAVESKTCDENMIQVLLERGGARADVKFISDNGNGTTTTTALHVAAKTRDVRVIQLLLSHVKLTTVADEFVRDDEDYTPLHAAASATGGADIEVLRALLDFGFHVNAFSALNRRTPLHLLCQNERHLASSSSKEIVRLFAQHLAELDFKDSEGNTSLHFACEFQLRELALSLVDEGASLYLINLRDNSPLDLVPPGFAIQLLCAIKVHLFLSRAERDHRHLAHCMVCKANVNVGFLKRRVADHCRRCGRLCCAQCGAHRSVLLWEGESDAQKLQKICKHCAEILMDRPSVE